MKAKERPGPATLPAPGVYGAHAETQGVRAAAFAWEDWFRQATITQQGAALALAQRQGYVYAHQLPAPSAKPKLPTAPAVGDGLDRLRALLAGKLDNLVALVPGAVDHADASLTAIQQQAIARVVGSPDIALLRAKPGQAAAVLADVVIQASRAGQRVLFLTQQPASLDQVLQRLHGRDAVLPVRFLDAGETVAQLAPPVRTYTLDSQRQLFQTNTLVKAQEGRIEAEERCRRRYDESALWPQVAALAERHAALEEKRRALQGRIDETPAEVRREAEGKEKESGSRDQGSGDPVLTPDSSFALQIVEISKTFHEQAAEFDRAAREHEERQAKLRVDLAKWQQEADTLQPLLEAKQRGRWWTGAWWRATFTSNLAGGAQDLDKQHADLQAALAVVEEILEKIAERRCLAEASFATARAALLAAEGERRRHEWAAHIAEIEQHQAPLVRDWQVLSGKIDAAHIPAQLTPAAVAEAQTRWAESKQHDEAACLFARQWASFVQESAPHFVAQLPRYASLLAGTVSALAKNSDFGAFADGPFDLVIIDAAERLLENDLLRLAHKGRRWLFVGQSQGGNGRLSSFDKLWQTLHADPAARLAYRWTKERARWCCQLRPVAVQERRYLEVERLADFPEIELRILSLPKARPQLAQVIFPATMTLAQAKVFIYGELQEAAVQPAGRGAWLEERADVWTLHLGPGANAELIATELESGLREWAAPHGPTHRLDFDKSRWQHAQVDEWIHRCLNLRDLGRTFELELLVSRDARGSAGACAARRG